MTRHVRNIALKKYVPFTETEWKYVQRTFMTDDLNDLQRVVSLLSMWICRMQHDAPVIIGISEMVLHAHLNGKKLDIGTVPMERADLGLIYGSTITRFINYVNEVCQDPGQTLSIASAVNKMGIPSWVVNIRHQATHGQMPPLNLMREAILFCRNWLWRKHWQLPFNVAIKENLSQETVEKHREAIKTMTGHHLVTALNRFREWRRRYRSLDHFHSVEGRPMERVRIDIERLLDQCPEEFLLFFAKSCLAPASAAASAIASSASPVKPNLNGQSPPQPGQEEEEEQQNHWASTNDELPSSLFCIDEDDEATTSNNNILFVNGDGGDNAVEVDDVDEDGSDVVVVVGRQGGAGVGRGAKCDGTPFKFLSHQKFIDEISSMEQNYYRPVLILINNKGCLQRLLVELTRLVSQGEMAFGELRRLAGWANLLLHAYLEIPDSVSTQNWRLILKHTVLSPQFFKDDLIDKLLDMLGDAISDRCRQRLFHLLKIGRQSVPSSQQQQQQPQNGTDQKHTTTMMTTTELSSSSSAINNNSSTNDNNNILDLSMQSVKSLSDLQERIRREDLADSTFVRDPLTLEDAWSIAQPDELGPLGLTADQRPDTLCLTLGEWGDEMRRGDKMRRAL